jgi:hypothetical protein
MKKKNDINPERLTCSAAPMALQSTPSRELWLMSTWVKDGWSPRVLHQRQRAHWTQTEEGQASSQGNMQRRKGKARKAGVQVDEAFLPRERERVCDRNRPGQVQSSRLKHRFTEINRFAVSCGKSQQSTHSDSAVPDACTSAPPPMEFQDKSSVWGAQIKQKQQQQQHNKQQTTAAAS